MTEEALTMEQLEQAVTPAERAAIHLEEML
jgi:hypothetical protein